MAVEIHILSGARSGERIVLEETEFRIGDVLHCAVVFDPHLDRSAKDRSVLLRRTGDGWFIRSVGAGEVLLNQTPIAKETSIRSGDLVRLSELGPDFSFTIMSRAAATTGRVESVSTRAREAESIVHSNAHIADKTGSAEASVGGASPLETPSRPRSGFFVGRWKRFVWAGGTAAAILLLVAGPWYQENETEPTVQTAPEPETTLELEAVSVQTATEGTKLTLRLRVKRRGSSDGQPVFILIGQSPEGARIDHQTGVFTWTPTEEQGPGEHAIRVQVSAGDARKSKVETTFRVEVRELNSPPTIRPIEEKRIDAGKELVFSVAADDPDQPPGLRTFYLSDGPDWISVDRNSGVVRCFPPDTADGRFGATLCVSDNGQPPLEDKTMVRLVVHGDSWIRVQKEFRETLFIVQVEKGGVSWPHATCCGIGDHTFLTTAREVVDLASLHHQGYRIWAVSPVTGAKTAIRAFRVPQAVADLTEPGDWFYVNLGLLETEEKMPKKTRMASPEDLRDLEEGQPVACFGFSHDGSKITRFDKFEPQWILGEVYLIGTSPRLSGNFRLLELKAKIPENMYGSPILNRQGAVIALYGRAAPHESAGVKDLHYASVLEPQLLKEWIDRTDGGDWITPRVPEAVSSPQPPSQTQAN